MPSPFTSATTLRTKTSMPWRTHPRISARPSSYWQLARTFKLPRMAMITARLQAPSLRSPHRTSMGPTPASSKQLKPECITHIMIRFPTISGWDRKTTDLNNRVADPSRSDEQSERCALALCATSAAFPGEVERTQVCGKWLADAAVHLRTSHDVTVYRPINRRHRISIVQVECLTQAFRFVCGADLAATTGQVLGKNILELLARDLLCAPPYRGLESHPLLLNSTRYWFCGSRLVVDFCAS